MPGTGHKATTCGLIETCRRVKENDVGISTIVAPAPLRRIRSPAGRSAVRRAGLRAELALRQVRAEELAAKFQAGLPRALPQQLAGGAMHGERRRISGTHRWRTVVNFKRAKPQELTRIGRLQLRIWIVGDWRTGPLLTRGLLIARG